MERKDILVLSLVIIVLFLMNYNFVDSFLIKTFDNRESVFIYEVVDGDTLFLRDEKCRLVL